MSDAPSLPTRPKGPREVRIDWLWKEIWKSLSEGKSYHYWLAQADADMAAYRQTLVAGDSAGQQDLGFAEIAHRSNSKHFDALLATRADERAKLLKMWDALYAQVAKVGHSTMQLLALANGSAVLAALTYLGRETATSQPSKAFVLVIIFGCVGFLLTLLLAHVIAKMSIRPLGLIMDLTALNLSDADTLAKKGMLVKASKRQSRVSSTIGYAAAACLVAAITSGTIGLVSGDSEPRAQTVVTAVKNKTATSSPGVKAAKPLVPK